MVWLSFPRRPPAETYSEIDASPTRTPQPAHADGRRHTGLRLAQTLGATVAEQNHDAGRQETGADRADPKAKAQAAATRQEVPKSCASRAGGYDGQPVPRFRHLAVLVGDEPNAEQRGDEQGRSVCQPKWGFFGNLLASRGYQRPSGEHGYPVAGVGRRQRMPASVRSRDADWLDAPHTLNQQHCNH